MLRVVGSEQMDEMKKDPGGAVCPFTGTKSETKEEIVETVGQYRDYFLELEPKSGDLAFDKAILIVFPNLGADDAAMVDDAQAELKPRFVDSGLMIGEFHENNQSPGLRNDD